MNPLRTLLFSALAALLPTLHAEDPLEYWLADSAPFWSWSASDFEKNAKPLGFKWVRKDASARAAPLRGEFFQESVLEAVVRFEDGSPDNIALSFFNRGDAETPLDEAAFKDKVRTLIERISSTLNVQPRPGTQGSRRAGTREDRWVWQRPKIQFELAFSYSPSGSGNGFRAEFIRLTARKFTTTEIPSHAIDRVNPYTVREKIQRDPKSGDVWISDIPMVDQGPKGYCAAATSERILRFFGQEVDQHEVAQIANTTSGGGTGSEDLKKALQAVGRQYGFTFKSHIEWDFKDWLKEMKDYNRMAEKHGARQVLVPTSGVIMINEINKQLDPETLKATRLRQKSDFRKFERKIKHYVDAGCPLAWSVTLGLFKESTPTGAGGHLRMIIGYNTRTREILYSDTWGRGHEKKRMPLDTAFTITSSLFSLEPKGLRL